MKSFSRKNKKVFKKIFTLFLMLFVLANAGFFPVVENGFSGSPNSSIKIAEAQGSLTTEAINKNAKDEASKASGYYPGQKYSGGIYERALNFANANQNTNPKAEAEQIAQNAYDTLLPLQKEKFIAQRDNDSTTGTPNAETAARLKAANEAVEAAVKEIVDSYDLANAETGNKPLPEKTQEEINKETQATVDANQEQVRAEAAKLSNPNSGGGQTPDRAEAIECGIGKISVPVAGEIGASGNIEGCVAILAYNVLKISAAFLHLVGILFDLTLNFTLNIGRYIPRSTTGELGLGGPAGAIYVGWSTIRDFINVAFIFVLLYAAISIILQTDKYGLQKTVVKVVIAALLLNFSLFFTKAIIDLSNIIALQFYARMLNIAKDSGGQNNSTSAKFDGELSSGFRNAIGLQSLWTGTPGETSDVNQFASGLTPYKLIALSIFGSVFILVFAFVLFMATVLFVLRSIVLIFLLITSPIGFLFGAVPGLEGTSKDWWERLKKNAIFAPAYMAVMYISCLMIFGGANSTLKGGSSLRDLITSTDKTGSIGIAFWFAFVIGFLIAAQLGARKFADSFGSSFAGKAEKWFKSAPLLRYTGAAALTRIGLGNAARAVSENRVAKRLLTAPGIRQIGGQATYNSIKKLQEVKIGGKSYKDAIDERVKSDQTTFERLGETTVRRRYGESDNDFKIRETLAKNATVRARARFMGVSPNATNIEMKDVKDEKGNPIQKSKFIFWKENLKKASISKAGHDEYKKDTEETFGAGRRKSRKEIGKLASPTKTKGTADDIEEKIKKAQKEFDSMEAFHDAEIKDRKRLLDGIQNPDPDAHKNLIESDPAYRRSWAAAKSRLDAAQNKKDKMQEKIDNLFLNLRKAQNTGDKK